MPVRALLLAGAWALASPALADAVTHPTARDIAAWKHAVIDRYDKAVYLDEHGKDIGEEAFFRTRSKESRNYTVQMIEGSTALITLRLLPRVDPVFTPSKAA